MANAILATGGGIVKGISLLLVAMACLLFITSFYEWKQSHIFMPREAGSPRSNFAITIFNWDVFGVPYILYVHHSAVYCVHHFFEIQLQIEDLQYFLLGDKCILNTLVLFYCFYGDYIRFKWFQTSFWHREEMSYEVWQFEQQKQRKELQFHYQQENLISLNDRFTKGPLLTNWATVQKQVFEYIWWFRKNCLTYG